MGHVTVGRDGEAYTVQVDGALVGRYATPEVMQAYLGMLTEKVHQLEAEVRKLEEIIDEIPAIVDLVAVDCGKDYIDRPTIYRRGDKWRYHVVRAGNQWEDAETPLLAIAACAVARAQAEKT